VAEWVSEYGWISELAFFLVNSTTYALLAYCGLAMIDRTRET